MLHERVEDLLLEKLRQRHREFDRFRYWSPRPITQITYRETTEYEKIEEALSADGWREIRVGDEWAGNGEFAWFRFRFTVPPEYAGKRLVAILRVGTAGWLGGEGCLFLDRVPYQGIDPNHQEVVLSESAEAGKEYDLVAECVSTPVWQNQRHKVRLERAEIAAVNREVWDYWFDLGFILALAESLPMGSRRRSVIIRTANKSVDAFDTEAETFEALSETARNARKILAPLYSAPAEASALEVACNGHSHIDVAWLWPYAETVRKCSRTFSTVDRLMDEYPDYLFTQSQAQLYEFTKEHYPKLYERIKKRVKERRFEPQGSMWVEADCNICSGESLVRQILLGKTFFMEEFGIETDVFWLPDVFGYSAALPQIIKKAGINYFSTIKISWSQFNRFPYSTFWWEGIDGTRVLAHFPPSNDYNGRIDPQLLRTAAEQYREKDRSDIFLQSFGWGDGGGGPDRTHLENLKRARNLEGVPRCTPMWVTDFFHQLEKRSEDLPVWVGELYLEYHRGTYTTQARNKRANRKSELLLRDAEMAASLAWILSGLPYPHSEFTRVWKLVCKNQFHDVIPGTSVTAVYEDSAKDYQQVQSIGEQIRDDALERLGCTKSEGRYIHVFNSLNWSRSDAIKVAVPGEASDWHVETLDGEVLLSQPSILDRSILWIEPKLERGISVSSLRLSRGHIDHKSEIKVSEDTLENRFFRIKLDRHGMITSILDKRVNREVIPEGERANVLQLFEDKPLSWDAWDIDFYYRDKCCEVSDVSHISVEDKGPVRGSVFIRRKFGSSVLEQRIVLWNSVPRIDFETWVDWHESKKMLKVAFPVNVHANSARFEIQFGSVERPNHWNTSWDFARFEVAAQKWIDISQPDYGVSLMNDCKYGHDVHQNVLRMTLLRSPSDPDPTADRGEHLFTYSLMPHPGTWRDAATVNRAYELNAPPVAWLSDKEPAYTGVLLGLEASNLVIDTIKKAEKEDAIVIRIYESWGVDVEVKLDTAFKIAKATECDLLERDLQTLEHGESSLLLSFKPFEIKTVKLVPCKS
jgi:alpha-mannosidase